MESSGRPRNVAAGPTHQTTAPKLHLSLNPLRSLLWTATAWVRKYVTSFPITRGRGVVLRRVVTPMLPSEGSFRVELPSGYHVRIGYRERIGVTLAVYGDFEEHERAALLDRTHRGTTAIDVGANIGLYALELSKAVGADGIVIAIEPWPDNIRRLHEAIASNSIANVRVLPCAIGQEPGVVEMYGGRDPAYVTSMPASGEEAYSEVHRVPQRTLDEVWSDAGRPTVSVIKIDVEGAELGVLTGARSLLETCHPALLCEANSPEKSVLLNGHLGELGYRPSQPRGFEPWNFLYVYKSPG